MGEFVPTTHTESTPMIMITDVKKSHFCLFKIFTDAQMVLVSLYIFSSSCVVLPSSGDYRISLRHSLTRKGFVYVRARC